MRMKKLLALTLCVLMMLSTFGMLTTSAAPQIKNIIYMIPDGGGMEPFYLADAVKAAGGFNRSVYPNATQQTVNKMYLKDYLVGAETTHSNNQAVTDSAASGTALATGKKTNNYMLGINPARKPIATILEAAQYVGKRAGLVSTYPWAHATPGAFSAHAEDRYDYRAISQQQINQGLDVVLPFNATGAGAYDEAAQDIASRGYTSVNSISQMLALQPGQKVWGNLGGNFSFSNRDVTNAATYPDLAEMTKAAIQALDGSDEGFFLMVEGSAVDGGGHANHTIDMVGEFIAFDEACKVAIEYAKGRNDTLVIALPDHDTGGMTVRNQASAVSAVRNGTQPSSSYVTWESGSHTARNGGIFLYVPQGVSYIPGVSTNPGVTSNFNNYVVDNTAIAPYLAGLIGVDLEEMTKKLFVDVSALGTYTPVSDTYYDYDDAKTVTTSDYTGTFKFKDYNLTVERNTSVATYNGQKIDLDGQVCVYTGGRFYVPQLLLDTVGIEFDPSTVVTASSVLIGADLANSVQGNRGVTIGSDSVIIQQNSYTSAYVTFEIGVPKTAYYNVQAMIDTSNRPMYGNNLYGDLTGEFDNGGRIIFAKGALSDPAYWSDDSSDSVLLEAGNHTLTFTSADAANNIIFKGLQLVEDLGKTPPGETPPPVATPTPTEAPDYNNITTAKAPYAGVYTVTSDKAVTLTNETGHTVTLAANTPAYFYMIKGSNNVTMSDTTAKLTFTALEGNGMEYLDQVNAGEARLTNTHIKYGYENVGNVASQVTATYGNVSVGANSVSIPNSSNATFTVDIPEAGLYYITVITSGEGKYVRVDTDTGHYGQYAATKANSATHYEDEPTATDLLMVYLRQGTNNITISNNGPSTINLTALRCSKTVSNSLQSNATSAAQLNMASCKVIFDGYDPDGPVATPVPTTAPTATPAPTPSIIGDISYTNAPYAGVYEVSSDKAVTLTNETGHTVTLAAGVADYFYMIKGNNNVTLSDATATLTFTALEDNGLTYIDQVSISKEPITGPEDAHVATSGAQNITLAPGEARTFTHDASKYGAGIYYPYIAGTEGITLKVTTDTGYYAEILLRGGSSSAWADGSTKGDPEMVYLRDGVQTITLKNTGGSSAEIISTKFGTTSVLSEDGIWKPQMKMAALKVVPDGQEEEIIPTPVPTAAPTPVPTATPTPAVPTDSMTYDAPYAGVYKVTSNKAVTLLNETGHKVSLAAGGTGYFYMFKGVNHISTSDASANVSFAMLDNNGMSYIESVAVDHLPITTEHIYIGFDANKDGGYNVNDFVVAKDSGVTSSGRYITVPVGKSVTLQTSANTVPGLYYVSIKTTDTANNIRLETDTGYYGVWKYTIAEGTTSWSGTTHFEDCDINGNGIDFLWIYLKEGVNELKLINNGDKAFTTEGIRPSRSSSYETDYRTKMSNATVIPYNGEIVVPTPVPTPEATPTPTPNPTPDIPANAITYDAPYAGVYEVSSDAEVTLTSEIGSTATLAANGSGYIYLIEGANTIATTNVDANVTFTTLVANGMNYFNQVTIANEPIISGQEDLYGWQNIGITIPVGGTYTIEYTPSLGLAGMVYPYIAFGTTAEATLRLTSDTGFYADIYNPAGTSYSSRLTTDAAGTDIELLYVRDGVNTITLENIGSNDILLYTIRFHSVGELVNHATWGSQLNVANLKPVIEADKFSAITLNGKTKTATVSFTNMGTDDDGLVSLVLASYEGNKLTAIDITYIDTDKQEVGTTVEYSVDLPEATGTTLKAMLVNENLVPKAAAKDVTIGSLTGLKFSILGDSISTFNGYSNNAANNSTTGGNAVWYYGNNNGVSSVDETWWKRVADQTGMEVLVNNSYSGDKVCVYGKTRALQLHNNEGENPDVIAVFLGVNDLANGCTADQFAVNYPAMIAGIREKYPDAEIYLLSMLFYGGQVESFAGTIESTAETYGCTFVDLRNDAGFTSSNVYDYMADDYGVHPGSEGMEMIANCVVNAMMN